MTHIYTKEDQEKVFNLFIEYQKNSDRLLLDQILRINHVLYKRMLAKHTTIESGDLYALYYKATVYAIEKFDETKATKFSINTLICNKIDWLAHDYYRKEKRETEKIEHYLQNFEVEEEKEELNLLESIELVIECFDKKSNDIFTGVRLVEQLAFNFNSKKTRR